MDDDDDDGNAGVYVFMCVRERINTSGRNKTLFSCSFESYD
jgi:hypothetical protein